MPLITSVNPVVERATNLVRAFREWGTQQAARLEAEGTISNIAMRNLRAQASAFTVEYDAMAAGDLEADLTGHTDLYNDVVAINTALTDIASTISAAIAPDTHWATLDSTNQTTVAEAYGLGAPDLDTPDDVWASLHPDVRRDAIQHELLDATTVSDVRTAILPTYS